MEGSLVPIAAAASDATTLMCSSRDPIGRPFRPTVEAEILPGLVRAALLRAHRARRIIVVPEFRGPYGVADVAILETTDERVAARLALGIPPLLNQLDAAIVSVLHVHRPTSGAVVARELGCQERHLAARLTCLIRAGGIFRLAAGTYVRSEGLVPLGHVSVYEAKVDDWRRGFDQAATYATWADEATLALGRLPRDSGGVLDAAVRHQLGLMVDGVWRRDPVHQRLPPRTRLWTSEHLLAALAGLYQASPVM